MSIKTLHLTNCWHGQSGGISTFYRELLHGADRRGRQIRLVVPGARDQIERCGEHGKIYHVTGRPLKLSPGYRLLLPHTYLLPSAPLRRILDEERPDMVECCDRYTLNYFAGLLRKGWLWGNSYRPAVIGLHCERMDDNVASYVTRRPSAKAFCRWYLRWLQFPMCDHHIAVSDYVASELREVAEGHHVRRGVWVRPHGVASDVFRPELRSTHNRARLESMSGAPEGATLILYAGRLAPEKNLQLLVETMVRLEESSPGSFHLIVAGSGPLGAHLERECTRRIPGAAFFAGHIAGRHALAEIYANADIFVHPNPREPFGIAPLEAMAAGLALVAPDMGGVRHYADGSNAWLAPPRAEAFAAAIHAIRNDSKERSARQVAARATAERFDWENVTAGYFDLYDELHAMVCNGRVAPSMAPAFYSTTGRSAAIAGVAS